MTQQQIEKAYAHHQKTGMNVVGPGESMGEGDTGLVLDLLPVHFAVDAFDKVRDEVQWNTMMHRGG